MPTSKELPLSDTESELEEGSLYNIILFNDEEHTYQYVIEMLSNLFSMTPKRAYDIAYEADFCGQAVVKTCPLEEAFRGRDAIMNYGPDPRIEHSTESMRAIVQQAND